MTYLLEKLVALWKRAEPGRDKRVLVEGRFVVMTTPQARRFRELKRSEATD